MKILLLNPPNIDSQYINRDLMGGLGVNIALRRRFSEKIMSYLKAKSIRLPVMSVVYCASVLAQSHDVTVLDAANLDLSSEETLRRIGQAKPDWVVSITSIAALFGEVELLAQVKKRFNPVIGLMGDAVTSFSDKIMKEFPVDFIILGNEPEGVMKTVAERGDYKGVPGILYREGGEVKGGGEPEAMTNLESLPFPRWDLFPIHSYRYFPILRRTPFVTVSSTRGCPYGCIYCPYTSNQGLKYRLRSAQNVIDELVHIKERYGIRAVQFRDPTFTLKKDRTKEICEGMIKNKLGFEWGCETRVDCLDEPLVQKMAEAGLKGVNIGIESSDPNVVRNVKRGWIDPNHIEKMVKCMNGLGIRVSGFFVMGLPGENRETIQKTLDAINRAWAR